MITVRLDSEELKAAFKKLEASALDLTPAMRAIAGTLAYETEKNFEEQGRPKWASLQNPPERRKGGMILQDTGGLAASVSTDYDQTQAMVGSNKVYAAIHQLGGTTSAHTIRPQKKKALKFGGVIVKRVNHPGSEIPARPFLPIVGDGGLQPEAEQGVLKAIMRHLERSVGSQ
ncbi:MAG: phage virion morphogenesis protein [Zoogloeaceae bacterium]|jgi:phage virion morphogenesis protein|nr:phage virion morphogenesis protein [Zoogloeaceae bacterium]